MKVIALEFFICNKKHPTEKRFLFAHEMKALQEQSKKALSRKRSPVNPLKKAMRYEAILKNNPTMNKTALAKKLKMSRARLTQIMGLLRLPEYIREKILKTPGVSERALRKLTQIKSPEALEAEFNLIINRI